MLNCQKDRSVVCVAISEDDYYVCYYNCDINVDLVLLLYKACVNIIASAGSVRKLYSFEDSYNL